MILPNLFVNKIIRNQVSLNMRNRVVISLNFLLNCSSFLVARLAFQPANCDNETIVVPEPSNMILSESIFLHRCF